MSIAVTIMASVLIGGGIVYFAVCCAAFAGHFRTRRVNAGYSPTVSVIIAARNEEKNIGSVLDDLLMQDYPHDKLVITVVDDFSEDGTVSVVRKFAARDDRVLLREARLSKSPYTHKKKAIHEGILSTDSEIIMTVDADCRVHSGWVCGMVGHFTPGIDLAAGEVIVEGGGILGWIEALEFTSIQMMAAGLMNISLPVTCNGANLAYRRSAFERVGGFEGIGSMVSGDDDLLMQKIAAGRASSVIYTDSAKTKVHVKAHRTVRGFLEQRTRWASKIAGYPSRLAIVVLSIIFAFFVAVVL